MPLLNEIKDKESKKTSGSVQALTDTKTRDNTEKDYYDSKWLKERFSTEEINLLKKEFGITSDSALRKKVESMSDYDLDVLLNRLKNPGTNAYPGYEEPAKQPSTNHTTSPSSKPKISKEQEFENTFRYNKNLKGITDADFDLLKASVGGKEIEAKKMVINLPVHILDDIINKEIDKETVFKKPILHYGNTISGFETDEVKFKTTMNNKGITNDDFNNLVYLLEGNEILAMEYIEKYSILALQDMIKMGKALKLVSDKRNSDSLLGLMDTGVIPKYIQMPDYFIGNSEFENKMDELLSMNNLFQGDYSIMSSKYRQNDEKDNLSLSDIQSIIYGGSIPNIEYGIDKDKSIDYTGDNDGKIDPVTKKYVQMNDLNIWDNGCMIVALETGLEHIGAELGNNSYEGIQKIAGYALGDNEKKTVYKKDTGTDKSLALDFANDIGVNAYTTNDLDAARNVLENGGALILNVKSGGDNLFTEGAGHYITVTGINEDGTWHVENPNSQGYTAYLFGEDNFIEEDILSHMKTENFLVLSNEP